MSGAFNQMKNGSFRSHPLLVQYILGSPPSSPSTHYDQSFENKISPSILLIIIVLAVMFFISGLLHVLVRLLIRPPRRDLDDLDNVTVLQGQLQQLFHLHDSGVDQSYIDSLPVFLYKSIIGAKNRFDCAVCLCEFEPEDKLRLLPNCGHAFHLECIDTWLLSHSTCPLCRGSLLPDFLSSNYSPVVLVLESESFPEIVQRDFGEPFSAAHINLENGLLSENPRKLLPDVAAMPEPKVMSVKLGKLKMTGGGGSSSGGGCDGGARIGSVRIDAENVTSISNLDSRRCYSMGSFEYVLDEASLLKVPVVSMKKKQSVRKAPLTLPPNPGHRPLSSMCDLSKTSHSRREGFKITEQNQPGSSSSPAIQEAKRESFSVSKIWLSSKKDKPSSSSGDFSRRAFSFRLPLQRVDEVKPRPQEGKNVPEIVELEDYDGDGACSLPRSSECGTDRLDSGRHSLDSLSRKTPSFARKTINWIVGRQNRVTHQHHSLQFD